MKNSKIYLLLVLWAIVSLVDILYTYSVRNETKISEANDVTKTKHNLESTHILEDQEVDRKVNDFICADVETSKKPLLVILNATSELIRFKDLVGITEEEVQQTNATLCDMEPPGLGVVEADKTIQSLKDLEGLFPELSLGGRYTPPNCIARHKVAIIVPYRNRKQHLAVFLNHMHPFLMKQQLEYGIFVVEQSGYNPFNRAKLFNVGFVESNKIRRGGWECFVFHDVDLLPLDTRNMYSCPRQPRHMSVSIDKHFNRLLNRNMFGGVSELTLQQFITVNGFSNSYWGWGGEDDDMAQRLHQQGYHIARYRRSITRHTMLEHEQADANPKRYKLLKDGNMFEDGLSTLQYEVIATNKCPMYTHIVADIDLLDGKSLVMQRHFQL